jgi:hypothetical protein
MPEMGTDPIVVTATYENGSIEINDDLKLHLSFRLQEFCEDLEKLGTHVEHASDLVNDLVNDLEFLQSQTILCKVLSNNAQAEHAKAQDAIAQLVAILKKNPQQGPQEAVKESIQKQVGLLISALKNGTFGNDYTVQIQPEKKTGFMASLSALAKAFVSWLTKLLGLNKRNHLSTADCAVDTSKSSGALFNGEEIGPPRSECLTPKERGCLDLLDDGGGPAPSSIGLHQR